MKRKEIVLLTCTACPRIINIHSLECFPHAWVTLAVTFARQLVGASFPPQAPHWGPSLLLTSSVGPFIEWVLVGQSLTPLGQALCEGGTPGHLGPSRARELWQDGRSAESGWTWGRQAESLSHAGTTWLPHQSLRPWRVPWTPGLRFLCQTGG